MFYLVWWLFALKFGVLDVALFDLVYYLVFFFSNTVVKACGFGFCRVNDNLVVRLFIKFIEGRNAEFPGRVWSGDWGTEYFKGGFGIFQVVKGFGITFDEEFIEFCTCWGFFAGVFSVFSVLLCFILF